MNQKLSPRMRVYHILIVFLMILFSGALVTGVLFLLDSFGASYELGLATLISMFAVSAVLSALISYFMGRRILSPMVKLSHASEEVARGNFDVAVSDSSKLEEVQTTFRNFNAMVRELNSIAVLSNDFVANVSHEFKTPLTAIEGYTMLLQDRELSQGEREEYLDKILHHTRRLSILVENILMLSKIESKSLSGEVSVFRLDEQIRQAVVLLEPRWAEKNLSFDVKLDEISFRGCEGLLHHVWGNLLSNAIKASPPDGVITLRLLEQKDCIVFSVSDSGCGMSDEVQERIFEKFYQADSSHKSEGNGLGLPLVKRIVELCQGIVEVESSPEKGATFRIILPKL